MSLLEHKRILATRGRERFYARRAERDALLEHLRTTAGGLQLLAAPRTGLSELLTQTYDELFATEDALVPIYFCFDGTSSDEDVARRFAFTLLTQFVAFRRRDPMLVHIAPGVAELKRIAPAADDEIVDELIEAFRARNDESADLTFVRQCFGLPLRISGRGRRIALFFDDVHKAPSGFGSAEIAALLGRGEIGFVLAGRRRLAIPIAGVQRMELDPLGFDELGELAERASVDGGIAITEPVRDLAALRAQGDLLVLHEPIAVAAAAGTALDSFRAFETAYADSVFGGAIGRSFDATLEDACPSAQARKQLLGMLAESIESDRDVPLESWQRRSGLDEREFGSLIRKLNIEEYLRVSAGRVEANRENRVLCDLIRLRKRLASGTESRATIFADTLSDFVKRSPAEMADHYRRQNSIGLRGIMERFGGRTVPAALIDYDRFRLELKGLQSAAMRERAAGLAADVPLPQIVFAAHTEAFYRAIGLTTDRERSAVAVGFEHGDLGGENRTAWIAAEIDSKLEASERIAADWFARLETAAAATGFLNFKIWLVAPEGFSEDAMRMLKARNAIGSSRRQVELLQEFLEGRLETPPQPKQDEYEIVIPMSGDAEMVAAHTLEDIARRHNIPAREVNRIKTALVEACINAAEHSQSPDRRIHQRFTVGPDRISITVSNRGLRLTDKPVAAEPNEGRRGWGLKLMRQLMDEVRFELVDDGTRISMTKYFQPA